MKIHVLPMSPITWCHVKRTLHLTSSHGDARVVKAVVVSVQTPDAKWLREGGQHLVRRQSSQSADQPDGDAFNSCHPLNLLSTLPSLALKYPGGIVLETSCGLQGLSSRNGHVRSGSCGGPHLPSPAPIFPGWICVPVGSCCWNCSSEKGLSMTQRGPGYNRRQTIERYTNPTRHRKASPGSCPTRHPTPQPKQRSEMASSRDRACTVRTAQMLWQVRTTSSAVASPKQPIGTHA